VPAEFHVVAEAFPVAIGETAEVSKTLTATDLALFSAISGDFDPIHVDEAYALAVAGEHLMKWLPPAP